jgi:hypothetical protein
MFKVEEIATGILSYTDVMDDPGALITHLESGVEQGELFWNRGVVRRPRLESNAPVPKPSSIRDCHIMSLPRFDTATTPGELLIDGVPPLPGALATHTLINEALYGAINDYRDKFQVHGWNVSQGWQIMKYGEDGHFVNHCDDTPTYPKTVSMSFYLNDDYEGGEMYFHTLDLTIKPKANQMLMFPSNYIYNHSVRQVLSGTRYAIVGWWDSKLR